MNYDIMISDHISKRMCELEVNKLVTVSFCGANGSRRLWKSDISDTKGLFDLYAKKLSYEAFGRTRELHRSPERFLPVLAVPEYRTKAGEETFLHYHILTRFPPKKSVKLSIFTHIHFKKMGVKHLSSLPDVQVKDLVTSNTAGFYLLKNMDDSFTIQNTSFVGLGH